MHRYRKDKIDGVLYVWQGNESTRDERGASVLLAKDMLDDMGLVGRQIRVEQGKEPDYFRRLFKGKMVVHLGGKASGFANSTEVDFYDTDGVSLYHVRGSDEKRTCAVQVEEKAKSLSSGDCFVLLTPDTMYVWQGHNANDGEKKVAVSVANVLKDTQSKKSRKIEIVEESEEPEQFWAALGGKGKYSQEKKGEGHPDARLFQLSTATGMFKATEIVSCKRAHRSQASLLTYRAWCRNTMRSKT